MNIIFAGTPDFAAEHLTALIQSEHNVVAVLTQPDRRSGRGQKIQKSPVKLIAEAHGVAVHQPEKIKNNADVVSLLSTYQADIMVVVAYGLILPQAILSLPKHGCINVHASLLPRWRGSAPIHRAIEAGDDQSGICIMQMDIGLDTGDVLMVARTNIDDSDTLQTLHDRLAKLGCDTLLQTLLDYSKITPAVQNHSLATYAEKITKAETRINWQLSSRDIFNKIRGFFPWPIASCQHKGNTLRLWSSSINDEVHQATESHAAMCGQILSIDKSSITVKTGDGIINLHTIQKPGSKAMNIGDFTNGYAIAVGEFFE